MNLPEDLAKLIEDVFYRVQLDCYSDFRPLARAKFYKDINKIYPDQNKFFTNLQILTLEKVLPLSSSKNDDLVFVLLKTLDQNIEKKRKRKHEDKLYQAILIEIQIAEMYEVYSNQDFAVISTAFDTLHTALYGFDYWKDMLLDDDDTNDDLEMYIMEPGIRTRNKDGIR